MDDNAYIVNRKTCGKCMYYSGKGWGCVCCHYTLVTGKARPLTHVAECPVKKIGEKAKLPGNWDKEVFKGGIAVCLD